MRHLLRLLVGLALVSPVVWLGSHLAITRTDAYAAATEVLRASPLVRSRLGEVERHRLTFVDGFRYSTFGSDGEAHFRFRVTGSRQHGTVYLHLERRAGGWALVEGSVVDEQGRSEAMPGASAGDSGEAHDPAGRHAIADRSLRFEADVRGLDR